MCRPGTRAFLAEKDRLQSLSSGMYSSVAGDQV